MKPEKTKEFYRRSLPHLRPSGAIFFVTFRLFGSIPKSILAKLKLNHEEKIESIKKEKKGQTKILIQKENDQFFLKNDNLLDTIKVGPKFLKEKEIAELVKTELHRFDGELYDLVAYCIMSNHVHILIDTTVQLSEKLSVDSSKSRELKPLQNIMKRIKGSTAVYANRVLKKNGRFWQRESYDHVIRNENELKNTILYILDNPVKAGIVNNWKNHSFTFYKYDNHK